MRAAGDRSGAAARGGGHALVFFAKAPRPGLVKTRLTPPLTPAEAAGLYRGFLSDVLRPVAGVSAHYAYVWPPDGVAEVESLAAEGIEMRAQRGDDLWARMANCFEELFAEGHDRVVLRNTDSPDLPDEIVRQAFASTASGRAVLGPDPGGGYYLLGLAEPRSEWLAVAPEGGDTVLEATIAKIEADGGDVALLEEHPDVDQFEDFLALLSRRSGG